MTIPDNKMNKYISELKKKFEGLEDKCCFNENDTLSPFLNKPYNHIRPGVIDEALFKFHEIYPEVFKSETGFMGQSRKYGHEMNSKNCLNFSGDQHYWNQESDLIYYQEQWHSFYHHSNFSEIDWKKCIQNINNSLKNALKFLENSKFVILTFGTSYVYKFNKTNLIVSNCHKLPQSNFTRFRLSVEENINYITSAIKLLSQINPNINVILTVSPIRHLKDGAAENQLSKASLLLAIDEVVNNTDNCYYFPSYEIMLDELRDYRFYAQDMLHPGKSAIDYIWEKFSDAFFSDECKSIMKEVGKISKAKNHIPRNKEVKSYQTFLLNQIDLIDKLSKKYPHLNLLDDKIFFKSQLK